MRQPCSTYRLQLCPGFGFAEVRAILPYLAELGVTDLYLSPILEAMPGSTHGYDIVDHSSVRAELGGEAELLALGEACRTRDMGLVLDIVPNHMCIAGDHNRLWLDVLENGPSSPYARWFDVDWLPPKSDLAGKVLLPVLGEQFGRVLEAQGLQISVDDGPFFVRLGDHARLPLAPRTWPRILTAALPAVRAELGEASEHVHELESIVASLERLPPRTETARAKVAERRREREICRRRTATLLAQCQPVARAIAAAVARLNGRAGDPTSFDDLEEILAGQGYRLAHWRVAADEINYRRFFDINDLAAIRVEDPAVMAAVHEVAMRLVRQGFVSGLRVDHVDGLLEPRRYLADLAATTQAALRDAPGGAADRPWIIVEKITARDEPLVESWPVAGTTGYDFLDRVTSLLVAPEGARALWQTYARIGGGGTRLADEIYAAKKLIQRVSLQSEVTTLARRLDRISEQHRYTRDFTLNTLLEALSEFVACFPVYRTYVDWQTDTPSAIDRGHVLAALRDAKRRNPAVSGSIFDFIGSVCLLEHPPGLDAQELRERREFVLRVQQLTGPITAKALEDTAFYRFVPLVALNEVGGHPTPVGLAASAFVRWAAARGQRWPASLSTTSTHDTKRSEDVRARLVGLSEVPRGFEEAVERWREQNAALRVQLSGEDAPDAREEYFYYQTLLGIWPIAPPAEAERARLVERLLTYMTKAVREAKVHSSWIAPAEDYERALHGFVRETLDPARSPAFLADLHTLLRPLAAAGLCTSLTQVLLKATAPGVCDTYQGCETVSLTLVDPDNRHPVDHGRLAATLDELRAREREEGAAALAARLLRTGDERLKLWLTARLLRARRERRELVLRGDYQALLVEGPRADHVIAAARRSGGQAWLALAARFFLTLGVPDTLPTGACWDGTLVELPADLEATTLRDRLTDARLRPHRVGSTWVLPLSEVFATLPVALLEIER